jgi:hypothetical protein
VSALIIRLLVLAACALTPAAAQAGEPHTITGLSARQAAAVAATFVPLPERVHVVHTPCPLFARNSCAYGSPWLVFMHPRHERDAGVLFHELGHEFDWQFMSDGDRAAWTELRGRPGWEPERFASDYANCAVDLTHGRFHPATAFYSYIGRRLHRRLCRSLLRWWVA